MAGPPSGSGRAAADRPAHAAAGDAADGEPGASAPEISARTVGRAAGWAGIGWTVSRAAWFASVVVLAGLVPPRSFGAVSAAMIVVATASLIVGSGTRGALITHPRLSPEHLRYALALNAGAGVVLTLAVIALAEPVTAALLPGADAAVLRWLVVSVGLHACAVVPLAVLQRTMQFKRESGVYVASTLIAVAAALVAGILGAGVWALVLRVVLNSGLEALLAWVAARPYLPPWRELIGRGRRPRQGRGADARWFFALSVLTLAVLSADYVVVGRLGGAAQLGLYSLAFMLGFAPLTNVSWVLGGVLLPAAAATRELRRVAERTIRAMRLLALVLLPLAVPCVVLAPWLMPALLGPEWAASVVPFQILLPVGVVFAVVMFTGEALSGSGNVRVHVWLHVLWLALLVPSLVVLVRAEGIRGAALAHLLAAVPVTVGYLVWGARRLGLPPLGLIRPLAPVVAAVLAQLVATVAVVELLAPGTADAVARSAGVLAGLAAAAVVLLLWREPLEDARSLASAVAGRG